MLDITLLHTNSNFFIFSVFILFVTFFLYYVICTQKHRLLNKETGVHVLCEICFTFYSAIFLNLQFFM